IHRTWGEVAAGGVEAPEEAAPDDERARLTGPQLDGEGIDQTAIDALLEATPPVSETPEPKNPAEIEIDAVPDQAVPPAPAPEAKKVTQAEIDALFD
ncbi:MAG: hypothetical protein V3S87_09775, partial [Alphaproteobacteria bacterium]